jgi:hypothetical protein
MKWQHKQLYTGHGCAIARTSLVVKNEERTNAAKSQRLGPGDAAQPVAAGATGFKNAVSRFGLPGASIYLVHN